METVPFQCWCSCYGSKVQSCCSAVSREVRSGQEVPIIIRMFCYSTRSTWALSDYAKAFHGSAVRNWHSVCVVMVSTSKILIISRSSDMAFGTRKSPTDVHMDTVSSVFLLSWLISFSHSAGVYLAKDGSVSMGHYAQGSRVTGWRNSKLGPTACAALCEVVNLPHEFVSNNPFFVIQHTEWIVW
jgi:hypothetical protein